MITFLLAGLATLGPFSIDTYMPSFLAIGESLVASPFQLQQTLSVYLFCFAFMMLFHGTMSDSFGRRPVILVSLVMFMLASIGCVFSYDINHLLFFRGMQGLAAGAGMVVGRAMVRDLFDGPEAQRLMSRITMIFGVSPAIAPIIGGWLHTWFGWHSVFVFLALLGLLLLMLCYRFLPETLPANERQRFAPRVLLKNYWMVSSNRSFVLLVSTVAFNFAGFFLYIASAPVFVLQHLKLGETQFAMFFIPAISGVILGAFLSGKVAGRITPKATVTFAYILLISAASLNLLYNSMFGPTWPWAVLPLMLYSTGMSLAMPSITLLALDLYPNNRGLAASLQGFAQTMLNAVVAGLVSPFLSVSGVALAAGMVFFLAIGGVAWLSIVRSSAGAKYA